MTFDKLVFVLEFLIKNPKLVKGFNKDPFWVKADINGNELFIKYKNVTYTHMSYKVIYYYEVYNTIDVTGKENRDLLFELFNKLIINVQKYSEDKLMTDIENYENTGCITSTFLHL